MTFSFEPMLCESAERPPEGREWRYELKLDGFRAIGRKSGRSAQLWSRNQKDTGVGNVKLSSAAFAKKPFRARISIIDSRKSA
jgi:ATP-dependent DNA ligase